MEGVAEERNQLEPERPLGSLKPGKMRLKAGTEDPDGTYSGVRVMQMHRMLDCDNGKNRAGG